MSNLPSSIVIPLFDADAPTSAALDDKEVLNYGGVVSRSGESYWLHGIDDLASFARHHGGATKVSFAQAQGRQLKVLTAGDVARAGLNLVDPQPDAVLKLCQSLKTDVVVAQVVQSMSGHLMVTAFTNQNFDVRLVRKKYLCSIGLESYDESDYKKTNGKCPVHKGGTLN